jgi:hypothetical protein
VAKLALRKVVGQSTTTTNQQSLRMSWAVRDTTALQGATEIVANDTASYSGKYIAHQSDPWYLDSAATARHYKKIEIQASDVILHDCIVRPEAERDDGKTICKASVLLQ